MSYASKGDLETRLGTALYLQLVDDNYDGVADEARVTDVLESAEAEVNSYLARRYAVPVDTTGEETVAAMLRRMTVDLAVYRLHARRMPVPDDVIRQRQEAIAWLQQVASGLVVLPSRTVLQANPARGVEGQVSGNERIMTRESLERL